MAISCPQFRRERLSPQTCENVAAPDLERALEDGLTLEAAVGMMNPADIREQLARLGYWRGYASSVEAMTTAAALLGAPVAARSGSAIVHDLKPSAPEEAHTKSLSALHGVAAFPFHTDGAHHRTPPRWVVMRCVNPGNSDRATLLLDSAELGLRDDVWRLLERAVWWVSSGGRAFPASIVRSNPTGRTIRYDAGCMKPAAAGFVESQCVFESALESASPTPVSWKANDLLIFDNWRMLHARAVGPTDDRGMRHLQRVLVR